MEKERLEHFKGLRDIVKRGYSGRYRLKIDAACSRSAALVLPRA
jgi:hypothetical protein